ncbi:Hint domain-containing protein [Phaeobacter inhibens]|uniref:Hint domain-containing protein n=1 Tax=Phaeobacter inhibens TaxID=221822 RepID=UPI0021A6C96D|nr:Hint domain-containing protein [Phaeobacter inhibens]UWR75230.1 Hint domain-containing protein [Phaeobacter inhibens]
MTIPQSLRRAATNAVEANALLKDPAAQRGGARPQLRRYDVCSLLPNGSIAETRHVAPSLPLFEEAFTAFCRGSLIETSQGPIAIEDLLPGDELMTFDGDRQPLLWKGCTSLIPSRSGQNGRSHRLTSFTADSLGEAKPMSTVVTGPAARLLQRAPLPGIQLENGASLVPVQQYHDGMSIVETAPPTAVDLYHICLPRHAVINVGGLPFETYHPGPEALKLVSHAIRTLYLNLFSHVESIAGFGSLAYPRVEPSDPDMV